MRFLPLRADQAELRALCERYVSAILPNRSDDARKRWIAVAPALGGESLTPSWRREPAGRLHAVDPPAQTIPNAIRAAFKPRSGGLFVDADWSAAHPSIAAARSQDAALLSDLGYPGYYEWLASEVLLAARAFPWAEGVTVGDLRPTMKRAVCAFVNGGRGGGSVTRYLAAAFRSPACGEWGSANRPAPDQRGGAARGPRLTGVRLLGVWLHAYWWSRYPTLSAWGTDLARGWRPGVASVTTLSGRILPVPCDDWRTLLSAHWSSVEAEAMDLVLGQLNDFVVLPLFDGVLLDSPPSRDYVSAVMRWAMDASGVPGVGVKVVEQSSWGVPVKS